jgi:hypothetical protein
MLPVRNRRQRGGTTISPDAHIDKLARGGSAELVGRQIGAPKTEQASSLRGDAEVQASAGHGAWPGRGETRGLGVASDRITQSTMTVRERTDILVESLILAQDQRWRRA